MAELLRRPANGRGVTKCRLRHYCHTVTVDGPSLRDLCKAELILMDDGVSPEEYIR